MSEYQSRQKERWAAVKDYVAGRISVEEFKRRFEQKEKK